MRKGIVIIKLTTVILAASLAMGLVAPSSATSVEMSAPELSAPTVTPSLQNFTGITSVVEGESVEVPVNGMSRYLVGAPNLVEAEPTESGLRLFGKRAGTTVVKVWNDTGVSSYQVKVVGQARAIPVTVASVSVSLQPGESCVLTGQNITRAAVSDPEIVDIIPVSPTQVLANAKKEGLATVRVWEGDDIATYLVTVEKVLPSAEEIAAAITEQIGIPTVTASVLGDTVVLRGVVPTADAAEKVAKIAEASDRKVLSLVTVEAISPEVIIASLKSALPGESLSYEALPDQTVMIRGQVANEGDAQRILDVVRTWVEPAEGCESANSTMSTMVSLGGEPEASADATTRSRVTAYSCKPGDVQVGEEYNFSRRVFGGRVANGPRLLAVLDINPSLVEQVIVTAQVIEVNRGRLKQLGIQWGEIFGETPTQPLVITENRLPPIPLDEAGPFGRNTLSASLKALVEENAARILSEPKVLIADGHAANILVGGEIPIPIAQSATVGATSISVMFKPFGIQLTVMPKITPNGRIFLTLTPEVSTLDFSNAVEAAGLRIPALRTRRATTVVHVGNGEALVIGGLLSSEDVKVVRRVPLLSSIPIIGELFKSRAFERNETELIIMVTPEIAEPGEASIENPVS